MSITYIIPQETGIDQYPGLWYTIYVGSPCNAAMYLSNRQQAVSAVSGMMEQVMERQKPRTTRPLDLCIRCIRTRGRDE